MRFAACLLLLGCLPPEASQEPSDVARTAKGGATPARPTCYVFLMTDCPVANAYAPEIRRIAAAHQDVDFVMVYVDGDEACALRHAAEYSLPGRVVVDAKRELVRATGASVVPEAAVVSNGALLYRGRIDDRYPSPGVWRWEPTTRELRAALEAVASGRPAPVRFTEAVGCFIPEEDR
jgi:hypothetical protein